MKDAFGGLFTVRLMMIFFVLYVGIIGVALNIAKAYRIKNGVINILEQEQYSGGSITDDDPVGTRLYKYFNDIPYIIDPSRDGKLKKEYCNDSVYYKGTCIIPGNGDDEANYYKVIIFMDAVLPFMDINLTIPISGETMTIRNYK